MLNDLYIPNFEQKEELIKRLTEVSSEVMKVPQEFFVTTIK